MRIIADALTGILAALAGVVLTSRLMRGTPTAGNGLELQALAAAVTGGGSLEDGEGPILGGVFVAFNNNATTMLAVSVNWQMIIIDLVPAITGALDMLRRRTG